MTYAIPRPVYEKLAETFKDRDIADKFALSIEDAVHEMAREIRRETIEKTTMVKIEVKEDLSRTLVTRELFEEKILATRELFEEKFQRLDEKFDERFTRLELWMKLLVGLFLFGVTLANPGFLELMKTIFR